MGCANSQKQIIEMPKPLSNSTGILRITLINGIIFYQAGVFKMDPYAILKLSNQKLESKVVVKGSKKPIFNETFTFFINSSFKQYGRALQITLMDKKKLGSDNFMGYGNVDLNPIINQKKHRQQFRCILNCDYKQAGFLNVVAEFIEQPYQILHFRFEQAIIKRNTSTFGSMNCWVQVTLGQQVIHTTKQKQTKNKPPMWLTEALSFKVLQSIKQCEIKVMDDDKQIGHIIINVDKLMSSNVEQNFTEDFTYEGGLYAGTLKFQTIKGKSPSFQFRNSNRKFQLQSQNQKQKVMQGYFSQKVFASKTPNPYIRQPSGI